MAAVPVLLERPADSVSDRLPTFEKAFRENAILAADPSGAAFLPGGEATTRAFLRHAENVMGGFRLGEGWAQRWREPVDLAGGNKKLKKDPRAFVAGCSMAPAEQSGVVNTCPNAGFCRFGCIFTYGNGRYDSTARGRVTLTRFAVAHPDLFTALLVRGIGKGERKAARLGVPFAMRPNVFQDIHFGKLLPWLFPLFPNVQFYGYTKRRDIARHALTVPNYHVTFSISEKDSAPGSIAAAVRAFGSAAVVIPKGMPFPATVEGFPTVDGDASDLRFLDPVGVVVILRAKNGAVAPFVREVLVP